MPSALFVSARKAPHLPLGRPTIYQLAEREFIREMRDRYSAIPPQVLSNKDLLELALPSMRADMEMFDTYEFIPEDPLPVPVHVLGGLDDPNAQKAELEPWTDHTTASCELEMFPGGHFFLNDSRELFLAELDKRLAALI
jgi:medium-chain acyl-[acyl-carrier-protein] hydrolase